MVHDTANHSDGKQRQVAPEADRTPSILVVDNEPLICDVIAAILRTLDVSVHTVWSGTEALQAAAARHFDLVLLDVNLPGLSGEQTLTALLDQDPAMRVVMMSGLDHSERAIEAGAVGFLLKPYRPWQVVEQVEQALGSACMPHRDLRPAE